MNKVILKGNISNDINYYPGDKSVAKFNIACNRCGEGSDFISCVAFGKTAEQIFNNLTKGKPILVDGRIQTGSYTNKAGRKVYTTDVVIDRFEYCSTKSANDDFVTVPADAPDVLPFD